MKIKPTLSIIVPFYNVETYFKQCLDSLICSELLEQYEIILIDDHGNDQSALIAKAFQKQYANTVKIVKHGTNKGLSAGRNTGIEVANGEYLMFVDSDDWLSDDYVKKIVVAINDGQCEAFYTDFSRSYSDREHKVDLHHLAKLTDPIELFYAELPVTAWGKVFKKNLMNNLRYPEGLIFEDIAIVPAVLSRAVLIAHVDCIYYYRQREGSIMDLSRHDIGASIKALSYLHKHIKSDNKDTIEFISFKDLLLNANQLFRKRRYPEASLYLNQGIDFMNENYPHWKENQYIIALLIQNSKFPSLKLFALRTLMLLKPARLVLLKVTSNTAIKDILKIRIGVRLLDSE
jgi:glycosyltransferase involved in cell wall biosynthesis